MARVVVRILHLEAGPTAGPLERLLADARRDVGERHLTGFREAGADDVRIVAGPPDDTPFGRRLRAMLVGAGTGPFGFVVLGAGSLPLATPTDRRAFVAAAAGAGRAALANNRYSADAVAFTRADDLPAIPDLPGDNALPRWLDERAEWSVADLGRRWHLQVDLDSPLDVELARAGALPRAASAATFHAVRERLTAVRRVADDRRAELILTGRTSATTLRWLERSTACRVRALVEERGLRASTTLATGHESSGRAARPPRSVLGMLLHRDGPEALGARLAELGDGALVDSRVLLAHRLGADEAGWPSPEDRFASDLLDADRVHDPWLRALTRSAADAPIPILLGGHTLVGPGARLAVRTRR